MLSFLPLIFLSLWQTLHGYDINPEKLKGLSKARLETCSGWQLTMLKEVKAFIEEDLPLYHNLLLKYSLGLEPELVLLNYVYVELDRIPINQMSQEEINELLQDLGFFKKKNIDDVLPEDKYFSPLRGLPNPRPSLLKKGKIVKRLVNETEDMKEDL